MPKKQQAKNEGKPKPTPPKSQRGPKLMAK